MTALVRHILATLGHEDSARTERIYQVSGRNGLLPNWTEGERRMAMVFLAAGLFGVVLAVAMLWRIGQGAVLQEGFTLKSLWFALSGGIGTVAGLFAARGRLGHPGPRGWLEALWGGVVLFFVAALVGGTLALPLYGTMFAPMMMALTFGSTPVLAAMGLWILVGSHLQMRYWRAERDTIFLPRPGLTAGAAAPRGRSAAGPFGRLSPRRGNSGST